MENAIREKIGQPSDTLNLRDIEGITGLKLENVETKDFEQIDLLKGIKELEISLANPADISRLGNLPYLKKLTINNPVGFTGIKECIGLRELALNDAFPVNIDEIKNLKNLTGIKLLGYSDNRNALPDILKTLPELKRFEAAMCEFKDIGVMTNIEELKYSFMEIPDSSYKKLTKLKKLTISRYAGEIEEVIQSLANPEGLQELRLYDSTCNKGFGSLLRLKKLKVLDITHSAIGEEDVKNLKEIIKQMKLEKLLVSDPVTYKTVDLCKEEENG